ncbi:MAG: RNA polymerase sigma factor [Lysobacterales bacterium]
MSRARPHPLDAILLRFGARLRMLVDGHCGRDAGLDADDIEQEVRIKLWKLLDSDKTLDFPASYIQKVVATTVIDAVRRAGVRRAESFDPLLEDAIDPCVQGPLAPDRQATHHDWGALLLRCVAELPERRRLPVQLALQGFTAEEIARLAGCTVAAAQQLSYRGIEDLKIRMKELGADVIDE